MLKKLLLMFVVGVLGLAAVPVRAQSFAEIFEGLTSPQLIAGVAYDNNALDQKWNAILTANILGPKLGTIPCYVSGVGVGLGTVAPGLEDVPIARLSLPILSCAPWGERVTIQVGYATTINGDGPKTIYGGIGVGVAESPNSLRTKRVQRQRAKEHKALLKLQDEAQRRTASLN